MIVNGDYLLKAAPIIDMAQSKQTGPGGTSWGFSEAGYDIRIAEDVTFTRKNGYDSVLVNGEEFRGRFALASAMEEFQMPDDLVGIVHDKSTHARQGISVFNTVIEPGWHGMLTLELVFHGQQEVFIPAGCGIAQVIFTKVQEPARYSGKYMNQEAGPQKARFR